LVKINQNISQFVQNASFIQKINQNINRINTGVFDTKTPEKHGGFSGV